MDQQFDDRLAHQLGAIAARGQRHLTTAARRDARAAAAGVAMRAAIVPPALGLATLPFAQINPLILSTSTLAWPLIVFVACCVVSQRRRDTDRNVALGLVDRRLHLKDRILTSAEFAEQRDRDGFREAALQEAQPWLDRAQSAPIDGKYAAGTPSLHRDWAFVAAAVALLALTILIDQARTVPPGTRGPVGAVQRALVAVGMAPTPGNAPSSAADQRHPAPVPPRGGSATGGVGKSASGTAASGTNRNAGAGAGRAGASGDPAATAGASAAAAGAPSPETSPPSGSKGQRQTGAAGTTAQKSARNGTQASAVQSGVNIPFGTPVDAPATPAPPPRADARAGAQGSAPRLGPPPPPRPAAPQGGSGTPPNAPKRPQNGQQSAQNSNRNSGQKGNQGAGRAAGQDALKKARGTSTLLLAVPMDDRLVGTANAGRVSRSERPATPQAVPAAAVAAQTRGTQHGDAGRIFHRADSLHDDRLLGNFFRRPGDDADRGSRER